MTMRLCDSKLCFERGRSNGAPHQSPGAGKETSSENFWDRPGHQYRMRNPTPNRIESIGSISFLSGFPSVPACYGW